MLALLHSPLHPLFRRTFMIDPRQKNEPQLSQPVLCIALTTRTNETRMESGEMLGEKGKRPSKETGHEKRNQNVTIFALGRGSRNRKEKRKTRTLSFRSVPSPVSCTAHDASPNPLAETVFPPPQFNIIRNIQRVTPDVVFPRLKKHSRPQMPSSPLSLWHSLPLCIQSWSRKLFRPH